MNPLLKLSLIASMTFSSLTSCNTSNKQERPESQAEPAPVSIIVEYHPGDRVPDDYLAQQNVDSFFQSVAIPDTIFELMQGKTFKANCTIAREELRYLLCLHRDKDGQAFVGEMIVNVSIADDVLSILHQLYDASYPIERMRLPDYWDADDERLMADNNSSSFNFRFISHTSIVSKHGLGTAVDINPLYNPYHKILKSGKEVIEPVIGKPYLDRNKDFDYKIEKGDLCYRLFKAKGFKWGGDWPDRKDYQHFEL